MNTRTNHGIRTLVFLALAAMMVLGAGTALAQGPGPRYGQGSGRGTGDGEFGPGHRLEVLAERLELTAEQKTSIEGIQTLVREKNLQLRKELMRLHNELKGEMLKDEPSAKAALDLNARIGALKSEIQSNRLSSRLEVRSQLTPEQRDKMLMLREGSRKGEGRNAGRQGRGVRRGCGHGQGDCRGRL